MVVRYEHMWITIPLNLVIVLFVVIMMGLTKLWMFNAPKRERHRPVYSLWVNKELPPDKPVAKKGYNPYYGMTRNGHTGRLPPKPGAGAVHNAPHKYTGRQMYKPAPNYPAPVYQQSYTPPQVAAGYPSQQPGFPSQQPGYPSQQAGYPSQQAGYPSQQSRYPSQPPHNDRGRFL